MNLYWSAVVVMAVALSALLLFLVGSWVREQWRLWQMQRWAAWNRERAAEAQRDYDLGYRLRRRTPRPGFEVCPRAREHLAQAEHLDRHVRELTGR